MLRNRIKKIIAGLLYFSGINFIYNKIFPRRLILIGGHSITRYGNNENTTSEIYRDLSITDKFLEEQIKYLLKNNYSFLNFMMIDRILGAGKNLPLKSVVMYFDDGFRDIYINAYPIFKKYNLPFVVFVSTDLIDQKELPSTVSGKLVQLSKRKDRVFLNWDEIKDMLDLAEIGSHGKTHSDFTDLEEKDLNDELLYSIKRIESGTGKRPVALSFPHGKYNPGMKELIKQSGFKFAITTRKGGADISNKFELKKIIIYPEDNITIFKLKVGLS